MEHRPKSVHHRGRRSIRLHRKIVELQRVTVVIVQFQTRNTICPLGITPSIRTNTAAHHRARQPIVCWSHDLCHGLAIPIGDRIFQQRCQIASRQIRGRINRCQTR